MEFSIDAVELQHILYLIQGVAVTNSKGPDGRILIKACNDGTCTFLCNNQYKHLYSSIRSNKTIVNTPGVVSVLYGELGSFVSPFKSWDGNAGAKDFLFSGGGDELFVSTENVHDNGKKTKAKLKIHKYDIHDILEPEPFGEPTFTISSDMLKLALGKILYAIDPSQPNERLMGANVIFAKDRIYFAGTNGVKLSERELRNTSGLYDGVFRFFYDFVSVLKKALRDKCQLDFEIKKKSIKARFNNVVFGSSQNIGRDFPSYREQFDKFKDTVTLDKSVLMESIRPMRSLLNPEDNNRMTLYMKNGYLKINNDVSDFEYGGDIDFKKEFIAVINGAYFLETIETINDDRIILKFLSPELPLIFDSGNFEDQKSILTPLKRR